MKPMVIELMKRTRERRMITMFERDLLRKAMVGGVTSSCCVVVALAMLGLLMRGDGDGASSPLGRLRLELGPSSIALRD